MDTNFKMENKYITMIKGDTLSIGIKCVDENNNPISDIKAVTMTCRDIETGKKIIFQKSIGDGVEKSSEDSNTYIIRVAPSDTETTEAGKYVYDVEIRAGSDVFTVMKGYLQIDDDVTKPGIGGREYKYNIVSIKGEKGDTGPQGPQGPQGEKGDSSTEVIDARVGYDGSVYSNLGTAIRSQVNNLNEDLGGIDSIIYSNIAKGSAILNNSWNRVELVESINLYYGKTYRFELDFDSVISGNAYLWIANDNGDIASYKITGDKTFDISYTPNKNLANIKLQVAGMYTGHCKCRVFDDEFDTEIEKIKNELSAINKKTSIKHGFLLGDMPKYEKQIISISTGVDDSFGPQGIATDGKYLFVTNGSGYVRKINIATKEYTDNLIGYSLLKHANSCDYNSNDNTVYICANGGSDNNNKVVVIDADTLSVKRIYTLVDNDGQPIYPHGMAIDQLNNHFYVTNRLREDNVIKLREFDKNGQYIGELEFNNDVFSKYTGYGSTQQGIGFDGTYFYVPLHSVGYIAGYDCILIFDRLGNYIRTQTALKNLEIEDICYDYSNNRLFANYGYGGNFITEFVDDSGWLNLTDFVESGADNIVSSDAKIKIKNGIFYTRGSIKVTNRGSIFRLSSRVSPHNNNVNTLCAYSEDDDFTNSKITRVKWSAYEDSYDMQPNYVVYCPNKGTIWLEGGCVPM